jgi:hypothetical protein
MSDLKTVSFDPAVYRLVPVKLYPEMRQAMQTVNNSLEDKEYAAMHEEMLISLHDTMPGVVVHSGEPCAFETYKGYLLHAGDPKVLEHSDPIPLFTHPPANTLAVVQAALEAAAIAADEWAMEYVDHDHAPYTVGAKLRAINKQSVIDSMEGK